MRRNLSLFLTQMVDYMFTYFDRVIFFFNFYDVALSLKIIRSRKEITESFPIHMAESPIYIPTVIYRPLTETSRPLPAWKLTDYIFVMQRRTKFERESAV